MLIAGRENALGNPRTGRLDKLIFDTASAIEKSSNLFGLYRALLKNYTNLI